MQPVSMLASTIARQLQRPQPDIPTLSKQVADMQQACKSAITTRNEVMAWFQPSEAEVVKIADETAKCLWLLTPEFAMRGCSLEHSLHGATGEVLQSRFRTVLMATLFAILDHTDEPVAVQLSSPSVSSHGAAIVVSWIALENSETPHHSCDGQPIDWDDVQVVAKQLKVDLQRTAQQIAMFLTFAA